MSQRLITSGPYFFLTKIRLGLIRHKLDNLSQYLSPLSDLL